MKKIRKFLLVVAVLIAGPFLRPEPAQAGVSFSLFYESLAPYGNWLEIDGYGYCWQPAVATGWRPYTLGRWAYTPQGWMWVSSEDFGWAVYHYGRWALLPNFGWVWVPGYQWGPAWVSWRTCGNYIGWAPLSPIIGWQASVGIRFGVNFGAAYDCGPSWYNFVPVRWFGASNVFQYCAPVVRNTTIIQNTTNITNIVNIQQNNHQQTVVYNGGPDFQRISRQTEQTIPRVELNRREVQNPRQVRGQEGRTRIDGNTVSLPAADISPYRQQVRPSRIDGRVENREFAAALPAAGRSRIDSRSNPSQTQSRPSVPRVERSAGAGVPSTNQNIAESQDSSVPPPVRRWNWPGTSAAADQNPRTTRQERQPEAPESINTRESPVPTRGSQQSRPDRGISRPSEPVSAEAMTSRPVVPQVPRRETRPAAASIPETPTVRPTTPPARSSRPDRTGPMSPPTQQETVQPISQPRPERSHPAQIGTPAPVDRQRPERVDRNRSIPAAQPAQPTLPSGIQAEPSATRPASRNMRAPDERSVQPSAPAMAPSFPSPETSRQHPGPRGSSRSGGGSDSPE